MKKIVLFAFNGELMCFVHVLLNAMDMHEKGYEIRIVIEGAATKLVSELAKPDNPLHKPYEKVKALHLMDGACRACSKKMDALEAVKAEGLKLLDEMAGHPSIARYKEEGYDVIVF
jgi:hypothetical protein